MEFLNELIEKELSKLSESKNEYILKRLKELNIDFDIEKEKQKRFKSFLIEVKGDSEIIYYNDGSRFGLKVAEFVTEFHDTLIENGRVGYTLKSIGYD